MGYIAKVRINTGKTIYEPGDVIEKLTKAEVKRLNDLNAIEQSATSSDKSNKVINEDE